MVMTRVVGPAGSPTGQGTDGSPLSTRKAVEKSSQYDTILAQPGVYPHSVAHAWNGLARNGIVFRALDPDNPPVFRYTWKILDSSGCAFENIHWHSSEGRAVFSDSSEGASHLSFKDCGISGDRGPLDQTPTGVGFRLRNGQNISFINLKLGRTYFQDLMLLRNLDGLKIINVDGRDTQAGHYAISVEECDNVEWTGGIIQNPDDRCAGIVNCRHVCMRDFVFRDSDWDGVSPTINDDIRPHDRGAGQVFRLCGEDIVVENFAIYRTRRGKNPYGAIQFPLHKPELFVNGIKIHNFLIRDCMDTSAFGFGYAHEPDGMTVKDVEISNGIIDNPHVSSFYFQSPDVWDGVVKARKLVLLNGNADKAKVKSSTMKFTDCQLFWKESVFEVQSVDYACGSRKPMVLADAVAPTYVPSGIGVLPSTQPTTASTTTPPATTQPTQPPTTTTPPVTAPPDTTHLSAEDRETLENAGHKLAEVVGELGNIRDQLLLVNTKVMSVESDIDSVLS